MRLTSVSRALLMTLFLAMFQGSAATAAADFSSKSGTTALSIAVTSLSTAAAVPQATSNCNEPADAGSTNSSSPPEATTKPKQPLSRRNWGQVGGGEAFYDPWARVLAGYIDEEGLVDYSSLADEGCEDLKAFVRAIGSTDPSGFDEAEQIAFWINAYNAIVIYQVVQRYPMDSVREVGFLLGLVGGFFKQEYRVANRERTLDNIEHDILRPSYNDPRIHWTLVCAAFGCPRLLRRPYVAADLDPMLTELAFEFMANPRALHIDDENHILWVSSYFDWYGDDFEAEAGSIIDYILDHAPENKAAWIREHRDTMRVRFIDYDWALNDQSKGPRSQRPIGPS